MVDVTSEAVLKVDVEGRQELRALGAAFEAIKRAAVGVTGALRPTAVFAAGATAMRGAVEAVNATARGFLTRLRQSTISFHERWAENIGQGIGRMIRLPFTTVASAMSTSVRMFASAVHPMLATISPLVLGIAGLGAAFTGLLAPTLKMIIGFKLLGQSLHWAEEQAEDAQKVAAETRRRYPGLVGEAFEKAQDEVETRMEAIASIVGSGAESLQDSVTQKFTDFRLGKGLRGDADIFKRWGITPEKVRAFEQSQGGRRMDLLQWMRQFVGTREKLEAQLKVLPEGSPQRRRIERIIGRMSDDTLKLFNKSFSDKAMTMTIKDLDRIAQIQDDATALGNVDDANRKGIEFDITLKGLKRTFTELTQGIGGDIQPVATRVMEQLRLKLIDVDRGGQGLGRALRSLGSELALKAWQTLDEIIKQIDVSTVRDWIKEVKGWNPKATADEIIRVGKWIFSIIRSVWNMAEGMGEAAEKAERFSGWFTNIFGKPKDDADKMKTSLKTGTENAHQSWSEWFNQIINQDNPKLGMSLKQLAGHLFDGLVQGTLELGKALKSMHDRFIAWLRSWFTSGSGTTEGGVTGTPTSGAGGGRGGGGGGGSSGPSGGSVVRASYSGSSTATSAGGASRPSVSTPSGSAMSNAGSFAAGLKAGGVTAPHLIAAVLGSAQQESSLDPNAWNRKEGAGGMIQWRAGRLAALRRFAASRGEEGLGSPYTQGLFWALESQGKTPGSDESAGSRAFYRARTVEEASRALHGNIRWGHTGSRHGHSQQWFQRLRERETPPAPAPAPAPAAPDVTTPPPASTGASFNATTQGQAIGAAAGASLRTQIADLALSLNVASTSRGVAPNSGSLPTGGDVASD